MKATCQSCQWEWKSKKGEPKSKQFVAWRIAATEHYEKTKHPKIDWEK